MTFGFALRAQPAWVEKKSTDKLLIQHYCFVDSITAYGTDGYSAIYKSNDSWETWEEIELFLEADQEVVYFEMTSKTEGIIVSKTKRYDAQVQCQVYITQNGGFRWTKVLETETPKPSKLYEIYSEDVLFDRYKDKLYAVFGDVFFHGKLNGEDWKEVRYPYERERPNDRFQVINDTVWVFDFGRYTRVTESAGETSVWSFNSKYVAYPQTFTLGNQIQKLGKYWIDQFNPAKGKLAITDRKGRCCLHQRL